MQYRCQQVWHSVNARLTGPAAVSGAQQFARLNIARIMKEIHRSWVDHCGKIGLGRLRHLQLEGTEFVCLFVPRHKLIVYPGGDGRTPRRSSWCKIDVARAAGLHQPHLAAVERAGQLTNDVSPRR